MRDNKGKEINKISNKEKTPNPKRMFKIYANISIALDTSTSLSMTTRVWVSLSGVEDYGKAYKNFSQNFKQLKTKN